MRYFILPPRSATCVKPQGENRAATSVTPHQGAAASRAFALPEDSQTIGGGLQVKPAPAEAGLAS
jgi:hypothetical protein